MGSVLDCSADPLDGDVDFSNQSGPIKKPLHAMTIKELAYNINYEKNADKSRFGRRREPQKLEKILPPADRKEDSSGA